MSPILLVTRLPAAVSVRGWVDNAALTVPTVKYPAIPSCLVFFFFLLDVLVVDVAEDWDDDDDDRTTTEAAAADEAEEEDVEITALLPGDLRFLDVSTSGTTDSGALDRLPRATGTSTGDAGENGSRADTKLGSVTDGAAMGADRVDESFALRIGAGSEATIVGPV